jgi:pimeloyl-ACP methyl ester carboxylesterase
MAVSALTSITQRPMGELTFRTHDGVDLFYRHWPALQGPARGAIVLFHRGHEHSARMAHLVDELDLPDFDFFAWDARGHGRSPGVRGFSPVSAVGPSQGANSAPSGGSAAAIAASVGFTSRASSRGS